MLTHDEELTTKAKGRESKRALAFLWLQHISSISGEPS